LLRDGRRCGEAGQQSGKTPLAVKAAHVIFPQSVAISLARRPPALPQVR
jgi:hypothetical protein